MDLKLRLTNQNNNNWANSPGDENQSPSNNSQGAQKVDCSDGLFSHELWSKIPTNDPWVKETLPLEKSSFDFLADAHCHDLVQQMASYVFSPVQDEDDDKQPTMTTGTIHSSTVTAQPPKSLVGPKPKKIQFLLSNAKSLKKFYEICSLHLKWFDNQHCATALHRFTSFSQDTSFSNNPIFLSILSEINRRLQGSLLAKSEGRNIEGFNAQELVNITWSLGKVLHKDIDLLGLLVENSKSKLKNFAPQNLSNMALTLVNFEYFEDMSFFVSLADEAIPRLNRDNPDDIFNIQNLRDLQTAYHKLNNHLAKQGYTDTGFNLKCSQMNDAINLKIYRQNERVASAIAPVMGNFAGMNYPPLNSMSNYFPPQPFSSRTMETNNNNNTSSIRSSKNPYDSWTTTELVSVAQAYLTNNPDNSQGLSKIADAATKKLEQFSDRELIQIAGVYISLNKIQDKREFSNNLVAQLLGRYGRIMTNHDNAMKQAFFSTLNILSANYGYHFPFVNNFN